MAALRPVLAAAACAGALLAASAPVHAQGAADTQRWDTLRPAMFPGKTIGDGSAVLAIDAPVRAQDAALVPISIHLLPGAQAAHVRRITVVVDANPSPLAAAFTLGKQAGITDIATRIRVDDYTYVHAVAEMDDGSLIAARRYVKAAGGCSAPATSEVSDGRMIGQIRIRPMPAQAEDAPGLREVKVLVNHPNYSGMQMNQVTRLYTPAYFINQVTISQGGRELLGVESGISIAENPEYRFDFRDDGAPLHVLVHDSENKTYIKDYALPPPA